MEFETQYEDLFSYAAYVKFCESRPELWSMLLTTTVAKKVRTALNKDRILCADVGDVRYVDLRAFGQEWYNGIGDEALKPVLPNEDTTIYVVPVVMYQWLNKLRTKVRIKCETLNIFVDWNHDMVKSWGQYEVLREDFVLVNEAFVRKFPRVVKCSSTFCLCRRSFRLFPVGKGSVRRQYKCCLSSYLHLKFFVFRRRVCLFLVLKVLFWVLRNSVFYDVSLERKVVFQVLKIVYAEAC